ncbi:MAG: flagellar type III secretion system pore protein FliP [Lachnospiraceae bacterium]|nr:flagellar type III secretion system pore protein FliP [Lachnospiraceae bacterium]
MKTQVSRKLNKIPFYIGIFLAVCMLTFICRAKTTTAYATESGTEGGFNISGNVGSLDFSVMDNSEEDNTLAATLRMLLILTIISLAPSILIMVTSFTRILIVLHFVRSALGTQTTPPNQVLIGLALFLTLFVMSPTLSRVNTEAVQPLSAGEITAQEALDAGVEPIREFMFTETRNQELALFVDIAGIETIETADDIPTWVLIPAFIISELRAAFIIGFLIYIPFIVIDMVVSSTLMAMGMMMLPPTTISMPFKILLFIMADGWTLVIENVLRTFKTFGG